MGLQYTPAGTSLAAAGHRSWHGYLTEALYVHPDGNDANDGLTWGTAKKTVLAAYDAVPFGGVVYIANNSWVGGEVSGQGLWFAGTNDPQYSSLPAGWRQKVKPVSFIGVGTTNGLEPSTATLIPGTGQATWSGPMIWLSHVSSNTTRFENLATGAISTNPYGIDMARHSNGADCADTANCDAITFNNMVLRCSHANANAGYNPWQARNNFWVWADKIQLWLGDAEVRNSLAVGVSARANGTSEDWTMNTASPTNWPAAPFTMRIGVERVRVTAQAGTTWTVTRGYDDTPSPAFSIGGQGFVDTKDKIRSCLSLHGDYLWNVSNLVMFVGGARLEQTASTRFEQVTLENSSGAAMYFVGPDIGNMVEQVSIYDAPITDSAVVEVTRPSQPTNVNIKNSNHTFGSHAPAVDGPATVDSWSRQAVTISGDRYKQRGGPIAHGQQGVYYERIYGQHDTARRAGLAITPYPNLVSHNPSDWTGGVSAYNSTGATDVFGLTNSATISNNPGNFRRLYTGAWNPSAPAAGEWWIAGDFIFFGAWLKGDNYSAEEEGNAESPLWVAFSAGPATFARGQFVNSTGAVKAYIDMPYKGNNEWFFFKGFAKVATGGSSTIELRHQFNSTICYPILFTVSGMRDAEAAEIFHHLVTYPNEAPAGSASTFRNMKLIAKGGLGVGNSASATTPGSVVRKMEVFDATGASLGFVPIYSSIT